MSFLIFFLFRCSVFAAAATEPCRSVSNAHLPDVSLQVVAEGLRKPLHAANAGDGSGRLFIVEQAGRIRILRSGKLLPEPFLDIRKRVASGGEKGLLSVAFHPRYAQNDLFYLNYTAQDQGLHTVISEFKASKDPDKAVAESERVLLRIKQPYSNHNGGQNAFGPDGFLYIGMGDGGSGDDPDDNGQNLQSLLGKMLRIDVNRRDGGTPYEIPSDNPFATGGGRPEIYAWGLRNPWRFSFDPVTGLLYAGDVGQDHWEEIDIIAKGGNYGWRVREGNHCTRGVNKNCGDEGFVSPIHEYGRGEGISVTGGHVYRGKNIPGLCGAYIFGDFGTGLIWGLRGNAKGSDSHRRINDSGLNLSSFGQDEDFELYAVDHDGRLLRLAPADIP